jgi:hypothetical protein
MVGLVHPNAIKSSFEQVTGLKVNTVTEILEGNWFEIELSTIASERTFIISAREAMVLFGQALRLEQLEKKAEIDV